MIAPLFGPGALVWSAPGDQGNIRIMHPQFTARPRLSRVWVTPIAPVLPAGVASLVGILLFAQMMGGGPAREQSPPVPAVSWRVPVESGALATVSRPTPTCAALLPVIVSTTANTPSM